MHDDGFTIAQNQKTTLLWFSSNAESMPAQRVPVKIDCLDLSNSMKSACPDCTSMKVQIEATYDPRIEAMAEFPGGGLGGGPDKSKQPETLRQSKVLSSSISDSIICWSFNVIHTWILHHKIMTCCCMLLLIPVLIVTVKVCESHSAARLKVASCKSLSPSREVIRYGADPLCGRCTPMITHVFIAGFRTNIDTVSEQCASNGDLPHSADTCIFFCEEYQQYVNQDSADRTQTKIEHLLFTCHSAVNAMFLFLLEIELQSLEVMGEKGILRVASAQTIQRPPRNGIQNPICSGL